MSEVCTRILDDGKSFAVHRTQDAEPHLVFAKGARDAGRIGSSEMRHAAKVPSVIVEAYCNNNGITFHEFLNNPEHAKALLNDPGLKHFRIWPGKV